MAKNNALQKPVNLSPQLEAVVGKGPMTRAQVTSKVWDHIKANNLQDSKDRRMINPDSKLGAVTGVGNIHIYAAMKGMSVEDFQKTRNAAITYGVAGKEK